MIIVQIGVLFVCLALAALLGAKAAREVIDIVLLQKPVEAAKNEDTAEQKRKAERARREIENFMTYDGTDKQQEGTWGE